MDPNQDYCPNQDYYRQRNFLLQELSEHRRAIRMLLAAAKTFEKGEPDWTLYCSAEAYAYGTMRLAVDWAPDPEEIALFRGEGGDYE